MSAPLAGAVVMVRPKAFGFNPETAASNVFQRRLGGVTPAELNEMACEEFDALALKLVRAGVTVIGFDDLAAPETPDAIFPNNWFCTLPDGRLLTFPLHSKTRRGERRDDILSYLTRTYGYSLDRSLEALEGRGYSLEGTGSLVLDHQGRVAYAALGPRTSREALEAFSALSGYKAVSFSALGPTGEALYHTNVMLTIGPDFAIIGTGTIDVRDRARVLGALRSSGKRLLELTNDQVYRHFAGNMLCLTGKDAGRLLVMSKSAERSLSAAQKRKIREDFRCRTVVAAIPAIERVGGGSVRCMLAEVF